MAMHAGGLALVFTGMTLAIVPAYATTYYLSPGGSDSSPGISPSAPFHSLWQADQHLQPGDTLALMPGTYPALGIGRSGKPGMRITYTAADPTKPPLVVGTQSTAAIFVEASYVNILHMDATTGRKSDAAALQIYNSSHVRVSDVSAHDSGGGGLMGIYSDYLNFTGNLAYNNAYSAPNQTSGIGIGFGVNSDELPGVHNIIARNISHHNRNEVPYPGTGYTTDGNGIIIDTMTRSPYVGETEVFDNLAYDNGGSGIRVYRSDNVSVINNTVYGNLQDPLLGGIKGEISNVSSSGNRFYNNIAQATNIDAYPLADAGTSRTLWDYNLTFGGRAGQRYLWASGASWGTHDRFRENPLFVSASSFLLQPGSPGLGHADGAVAPTVDLRGLVRPGDHVQVDIGAYQESR